MAWRTSGANSYALAHERSGSEYSLCSSRNRVEHYQFPPGPHSLKEQGSYAFFGAARCRAVCTVIFLSMQSSSPRPPQPKVVLFDVNETLLDMSKLKLAVTKAFGNRFAFKQWFGLLLQYSLVDTVTGSYHPFNLIAEAALDMAAEKLEEKPLKPARKREIMGLLTELPAHKDIPKGLEILLDSGIRLVAFTNSPRAILDEQLRYAGIIHYFEQGLSIDAGHRYKPHFDTYRTAVQTVGVLPVEAARVAAHGWDVAGALQAGLAAGFIARPGQELYPLAPPPTYSGKTLVEVARQIVG